MGTISRAEYDEHRIWINMQAGMTEVEAFRQHEGSYPMPVASPFHGAVQVEDYQLVPLLKALRMPRVNLMIADDVGLGKTIEAGLILTELLLRRRVQRVLILTPASLLGDPASGTAVELLPDPGECPPPVSG